MLECHAALKELDKVYSQEGYLEYIKNCEREYCKLF